MSDSARRPPRIGVLAVQGAVREHVAAIRDVGGEPVEVRLPRDLVGLDALILPGGESTTMRKLIDAYGLREPIAAMARGGLPMLGTCAGMILLAAEVLDGRSDQASFGAVDIAVRRNAFGRQVDSFEADLTIAGIDDRHRRFPAVFIRAPFVERAGAAVDVLAEIDGHPVVCRQGPVVVAALHPELSNDRRLHQLFLREV
jgi:pyridoxal 5'-phosphate synthase pdxT subunit